MTSSTRIDLVRHGEHTLGQVICGTTDPELTIKGWQQLNRRILQLEIARQSWDVCVTSPRLRCKLFAQRIARTLEIPCHTLPAIAEADFGSWEGLDYETVQTKFPGQWQQWLASDVDNERAPHGGEPYKTFTHRVGNGLKQLTETYQDQRVLCFTHGGVIRAMMAHVLKIDAPAIMNINVPHACHTRIVAYSHPGKEDWLQLDGHNMYTAAIKP